MSFREDGRNQKGKGSLIRGTGTTRLTEKEPPSRDRAGLDSEAVGGYQLNGRTEGYV